MPRQRRIVAVMSAHCLAMSAHRFPCSATSEASNRSSSGVHFSFRISGLTCRCRAVKACCIEHKYLEYIFEVTHLMSPPLRTLLSSPSWNVDGYKAPSVAVDFLHSIRNFTLCRLPTSLEAAARCRILRKTNSFHTADVRKTAECATQLACSG